jgi:hypothetical protein
VHVRAACVTQFGATSGWRVSLTYQDATDGASHGPFVYTLSGLPPNPAPCQVASSDLSAVWASGPAVQLSLASGSAAQLSGCSGWSYHLLGPQGQDCGTPSSGGSQAPGSTPVTITVACGPKPSDGWTVRVDYTDASGNAQQLSVAVTGTPPSS